MYSKINFVFGSNLAGRHGKGAALYAKTHWGAEYGVGEGPTGSSYAIPTKDEFIKTRPLADVAKSIELFIHHAKNNPSELFLLTPVGTGLAGFNKDIIRHLFTSHQLSPNIVFTKEWMEP